MPRMLIAGNWKMNGMCADGTALARDLAARWSAAGDPAFDMAICPPATLISTIGTAIGGSGIALGGQDCHADPKGAHTGDVAAEMLADLGCRYVIVGHSERRTDHEEDDATVQAKAAAAHRAGLVAILCIGETEDQRDAGEALDVCSRQLAGSLPDGATAANTVIAYEPVWAIGTGRTPTTGDVAEMHAHIRKQIDGKVADPASVRLLYGGSVKPGNAAELLGVDHVDGALVGGASLKADDFWAIAEAAV
ncbi:MAG: triose-phosphate isomerase [Deinococcus-Thermus bacterium]|jgi:triosephosphate isomerase|nr:triose-phosphate isomerase [Deinococcota bacterium]